MKKHLLLFSLIACTVITAYGQDLSIPNGNFETWNAVSYDYPQNYLFNSNLDVLSRYQTTLPFNLVKTADAYHGNSAIQLSTVSTGTETVMAYFINTNPNNGDPSTWSGGMPYSEMPTGITGYYKYNVASSDSALIFAVFSKDGHNIGTYVSTIGGQHTDYVQFNITFNPPLTEAPDSVIFAATSSNIMVNENGVTGSVLILDDVSFTGVASQPVKMNGDFETWESQTDYSLDGWYTQGKSVSTIRTADAYKGENAIVLTTYLDTDKNNIPKARAEQLATGYYLKSCSSNCNELGGYPFSNQIDTLAFWYKYLPSSITDRAQVYLQFKKNGISINGAFETLPPSADYQYFEIPFNVYQVPDTVIVNLQSTGWEDSLVSSVGSTFTVDEVHFKSEPILYTNLSAFAPDDKISVFPNPSDGKIRIRNEAGITQVVVYNLIGKQLYSKINASRERLSDIDLTDFKKGIYFLEINSGTKMHTQKIVIR